jgi:hypothetical protein
LVTLFPCLSWAATVTFIFAHQTKLLSAHN